MISKGECLGASRRSAGDETRVSGCAPRADPAVQRTPPHDPPAILHVGHPSSWGGAWSACATPCDSPQPSTTTAGVRCASDAGANTWCQPRQPARLVACRVGCGRKPPRRRGFRPAAASSSSTRRAVFTTHSCPSSTTFCSTCKHVGAVVGRAPSPCGGGLGWVASGGPSCSLACPGVTGRVTRGNRS